ncbi:MAG TPA: hypothetical protein VFT53_07430 [Candidatus Saccharimonadales bacterium]|nr:hypothetical protein [Candidatus Saccharimonadales bacterium]
MSDYKFRTVILPYENLGVQGDTYDEFFENLTAMLGDDKKAQAYMDWRREQVKDMVLGTNTTAGLNQAVSNVQDQIPSTVSDAPLCPGHGRASRKSQVKKDGPNKNRWFWSCAEPQNSQCKFFEWA